VLVIGQSASGKTTTARLLAEWLGVPHVELDALFHGPSWTPSPTFVDDVRSATDQDAWVVDGNYSPVLGALLWERADTVVWLDVPRSTTLRRAITRTARRALLRTHLWNGNRERLRTVLRATHPIRWTWRTFHANRAKYEAMWSAPEFAHLLKYRLQSADAVRSWQREHCGQGS
jgi:adenylate kinase family enzyme